MIKRVIRVSIQGTPTSDSELNLLNQAIRPCLLSKPAMVLSTPIQTIVSHAPCSFITSFQVSAFVTSKTVPLPSAMSVASSLV